MFLLLLHLLVLRLDMCALFGALLFVLDGHEHHSSFASFTLLLGKLLKVGDAFKTTAEIFVRRFSLFRPIAYVTCPFSILWALIQLLFWTLGMKVPVSGPNKQTFSSIYACI